MSADLTFNQQRLYLSIIRKTDVYARLEALEAILLDIQLGLGFQVVLISDGYVFFSRKNLRWG